MGSELVALAPNDHGICDCSRGGDPRAMTRWRQSIARIQTAMIVSPYRNMIGSWVIRRMGSTNACATRIRSKGS